MKEEEKFNKAFDIGFNLGIGWSVATTIVGTGWVVWFVFSIFPWYSAPFVLMGLGYCAWALGSVLWSAIEEFIAGLQE